LKGRPSRIGGSLRAVTPENAWVYAILPFLTMATLTVGFVIVFRQRAKTRRALGRRGARPAPPRPWWRQPWAWIAIVLIAVVLGTLVWPGLYALALVDVPVVWLARPRRAPTIDPRSNGHAHRDGGAFSSE
jgi:ABC-type Fe3+ transport system permease subunit